MLMHHSAESYGVAAARAADWATERFNRVISNGQSEASGMIASTMECQPKDYIVGHKAMSFAKSANDNKLLLTFPGASGPQNIHHHALVQMAEKVGMPSATKGISWLSDPETMPDFANIMQKKYRQLEGKKYLVRSVKDEIRGFLSDRYRRLDSGPIVESFIRATTEYGAVPVKAKALDTKFYLKMFLPHIFEPIKHEVMLFGVELKNSDFGDGKLSLAGSVCRLRCTNLMIGDNSFSQVHLGGRLGDDIDFSKETYDFDAKTMASAVTDVVKNVLDPEYVKDRVERIKALAEEKVDADAVIEALRKSSKVTKEESKQLKEIYSSADVELLPPGQNQWRLANSLSLLAQRLEPHRELELETLAGQMAGFNSERKAA